MQSPLQIEFDGLPPSEAVTARIEQRVAHLEKLFPRIIDGRIVVERSNHRHRKGNLYKIRIELNVPGDRLVISRDPGENLAHTDVYVAVRDAFAAMERTLQDYIRRLRGDTKHHDAPLTPGRIGRIFPYEGYGFIVTDDAREIYFDANSVIDKSFENLEVGRLVRFCEELGEKGPQATTVHA
jgi:ribosome-associated translation inhibitor RaiA/cold shock CspA family protein